MTEHSSDTSISARDYFRVKIDETPNKATARSLSQAFTAFTAWYPAGSLEFTSFSEDNLRQWTAWLLSEGYTLKTAAYYLKNLSALYGRAVADGIAAPATAFADVRTRLKSLPEAMSDTPADADTFSRLQTFVRQATSAAAQPALATDIVLYAILAGGLDFDAIAATLKDSYTGDNPAMLDIVARNSRPRNKYLFALGQSVNTPRQLKTRVRDLFRQALSAHALPLANPADDTALRLWCAAATACGISPAAAIACAGRRPRLSPAYALIDPATLTADEASSIRGTVAQALTDNPPQWHAMQFRPRVTLDDIRNRLSALHCAGLLGDIYYPCEEIASRIGRRLVRRRQPVIPGLLFFRTRTTDIAPLMRRIGDLAWCYRAGTGTDSPYAVIPDVQMHIYQVTIGIIRPDTRICPAGTIQLRPGDRVEIIGGPFAGLHANIQSIHTPATGAPTTRAEGANPAEGATICRLLLPGTNGIEWRIDTPTLLLHKA